ncbi:MAG: hypothetical protein Q4C72_08005 [Eubacteriales bacterium]|nr:hypothetical protein [Eubacteriales bacterium]
MLLFLLLAGGAALAVLYPRLSAPHVQSPYEAAAMLEETVRGGGDGAVFRTEEVELDEVYAALEARYPYAFSLHATTRPNGTTELRVELSRPARQEQAWGYAQLLASECVTDDMTDEEKLRALHDALIRLCRYDTETAEGTSPDGATAPFAADGALIDHKAVCAGYGRAYGMLCEAVGLRAIYIASEEMNHGWNAVRLDGQTYFIDCTFDDPVPDRGDYVSDQYFLLPADRLAKTHVWDQAFYEQALDSME